MLKVGTKVRCINNNSLSFLEIGKIYTISGHSGYGFNLLTEFPNKKVGFLDHRFELVINEPTDQELADDYRHMCTKIKIVYDELVTRGYQITCIANREIQISKPTYKYL